MDLMYFYPTLTEAALRSVCHVSLTTVYPAALAERALEIVGRRAGGEAAAPVLGLLMSLLLGKAAHVRPHQDWSRHRAVLSAAARCFASLPDPGALQPAPLLAREENLVPLHHSSVRRARSARSPVRCSPPCLLAREDNLVALAPFQW